MTNEFIISAPRGDNCFRVTYFPEHGGYIEDVEIFGQGDNTALIDADTLLVAVPRGKCETEIVRLTDYLTEQARIMYQEQRYDASQYGSYRDQVISTYRTQKGAR